VLVVFRQAFYADRALASNTQAIEALFVDLFVEAHRSRAAAEDLYGRSQWRPSWPSWSTISRRRLERHLAEVRLPPKSLVTSGIPHTCARRAARGGRILRRGKILPDLHHYHRTQGTESRPK